MATATQTRSKLIESLNIKTNKVTPKTLIDKIGVLGSPINGKEEGEQFTVTLTGNIDITEFNGTKSAHYTTKEGYRIKVNASFDPAIHKEGEKFDCVCMIFPADDGRKVKYVMFKD